MSATFLPTNNSSGDFQIGVTPQNNNIVVFDLNFDNGFPSKYDAEYNYFASVGLIQLTNPNAFWGLVLPSIGNGFTFGQTASRAVLPIRQFNKNIPGQGGAQTMWVMYDLTKKQATFGVDSPVGTQGTVINFPPEFSQAQSYQGMEILTGRIPLTQNLPAAFASRTGYTVSTAPVSNIYVGSFTQLTCLGLTNADRTTINCLNNMTAFCANYPNHPQCACMTAIAQAGPNPIPVPYECILDACRTEESYVPPATCPPITENICEQIIQAGQGGNISIQTSGIYQTCCDQSTTCSGAPVTNDKTLFIVFGIIFFLILIFIIFLIMHKSKRAKQR